MDGLVGLAGWICWWSDISNFQFLTTLYMATRVVDLALVLCPGLGLALPGNVQWRSCLIVNEYGSLGILGRMGAWLSECGWVMGIVDLKRHTLRE